MKKIVDILKKMAPGYGWAFLLTAVSLNMLSYFGLRAIYTPDSYHDFSIWLDHKLPFVPVFIVPYILAYIQWILGYFVIARENRRVCYRIMTGEILAKIMCLACFIFLPVSIAQYRPEVTGTDIFSELTKFIFAADAPTNLFPSIHCLESYVVVRGAFKCKKVNNTYRIIMLLFSVSVFLSTVFLKQHYIVDFFGAVAAAEIGFFIAGLLPFVKKAAKEEVN